MLCLSIIPKTYLELNFLLERSTKADLVEIRLDSLPFLDFPVLQVIVENFQKPIILTLRSKSQGGFYLGNIKAKEQHLMDLASLGSDYLDVESDVSSESIKVLKQAYPKLKVILSYHNTSHTPRDLKGILLEMQKHQVFLYKVVTLAKTTLDALRLLHFSKESGPKVLALGMGVLGKITRILAPVVDSSFTMASLDIGYETAPGQLTLDELINDFNYYLLNKETALCGLIGFPTTFSIGDIYHNSLYKKRGINAVYVKMEVLEEELHSVINLLRKIDFRGISVTIPYKEKIISLINEIDEEAVKIGAVNTLTFNKDIIFGSNTDSKGALDAIEEHGSVDGKKFLIIGAGGSSRAVAFEAKKRGAIVTIYSRTHDKSLKLARDIGVQAIALKDFPFEYDFLANATPDEMPILSKFLRPKTTVMDLKTLPKETILLKEAAKKQCKVVYGKDMFVKQASSQIESWFIY